MFSFYMCPDEECSWDKNDGKKGESCPYCGKEFVKVGFKESVNLGTKKKNSKDAKIKKEAKKAEKAEQKEKDAQQVLENAKTSIGGLVDGNPTTFILGDEGIRLKRKGFFSGRDKGFEEIKYEDITNIGIEKGFVGATIEIKYRGGKFELPNIIKEHAEIFVNSAREKLKSPGKLETTSTPMDEIRKAKELLDIGAITQEQFDEIRDKYLGQI